MVSRPLSTVSVHEPTGLLEGNNGVLLKNALIECYVDHYLGARGR